MTVLPIRFRPRGPQPKGIVFSYLFLQVFSLGISGAWPEIALKSVARRLQ